MRPLLIIGGGGVLLYYLYSKGYFRGTGTTTTTTGTTGGTTTTGTTGGTTTTGTTGTTTVNPNSLAAIFTRLVANAQAPSGGLTPDGWNYSLNSVQTAFTAPDPDLLFPDRTVKMSAEQYWAVVAPYLTQTYGLSGLGSLSAAVRGHRRFPHLPVGYA